MRLALPAWFLGHNPSLRTVVACYSDQLSKTHANDFRSLVNDPLYQHVFPRMRLTGLGGDLMIVDDPIKLGDAYSDSARKHVIEWYRSTLLSRGDDKSSTRIVVLMQRVSQNDLVGYLQESGGFEVLNLPAIAQREETYQLSAGGFYTRKKGELLHHAHESIQVLQELKREMGPIAFNAQYQQTPAPPGGNIIRRKWLQHTYTHIGMQPGDRLVMSWDIALSEADPSDFSVCVVLLVRNEVIYVLEVIRGKFPFDALKRKVMEVKQRYGTATLLIEDSPISLGLIQSLREQSINVTKYKPTTDKLARVIAQSDLFEGGSIRLPVNATWLEEFLHELLAFPGRHDDQVDALVQGIAWSRTKWSRQIYVGTVQGLNF